MLLRSVAAVLLLTTTAFAEPGKPSPAIDGRFAFDVFKPKQKCAKVAGALLARLRGAYRCAAPDNGGETGSGVVTVATCTLKKGSGSEFMLFGSAADCDKERETQLANAE